MKNIIVVLSGLLIGYLEATAEPPTDIAPGSPSSVRSRTVSSSSVLAPQKTKPIYIIHDLSFYIDFIDSFKTRFTDSKDNELKEELFHILKSAYFSNTSFLEKIQEWVSVTRCDNLTRNKILGWLNIFKSEREQRLADYTSVIIDLLDGYVSASINQSASSDTEHSFRNLLELATDNLDLRDIENAVQKVFFLRKSTEEKADEVESDHIDPLTAEWFQLFLCCLEPYKFTTPSRSRTSSASAALL